MMHSRRQFLKFLAPLAVVPVVGPHMLLSERPRTSGWTPSSCERVLAYDYELASIENGRCLRATNHTFDMFREMVRQFSAQNGPIYLGPVLSRESFKHPACIWSGQHYTFHQEAQAWYIHPSRVVVS